MSSNNRNQPLHKSQRVPLPHELTAEWTVKAHIKFAKAGEAMKKEFNSEDTVQPVRVIYKWSTLDANDKDYEFNDENDKVYERSRSSASFHDSAKNDSPSNMSKKEALYLPISTVICEDMAAADSVFCSSNNSSKQNQTNFKSEEKEAIKNFYGTRCQSTCNITVTAIADFLPPPEGTVLPQNVVDTVSLHLPENYSESYAFKTSANNIVQSANKEACTFDSSMDKLINQRDAICQTSDTEAIYSADVDRKRSSIGRRDSRRLYDYRNLKTADLPKKIEGKDHTEEGNNFKPSNTHLGTKTNKSRTASQTTAVVEENMEPSGKCIKSSIEPLKKPRTVHIDVYCTGSEDDGQADGETSSDDNNTKRGDQESSSTFQTVLENDQMRLSHHRITGALLPRRLTEREHMSEDLRNLNIGHALTKSSTTEEVNESKQLLFRKHIGDQKAAKLQNIRQKYLRQLSDDSLSLGYPNSSRSTIRDNTCSSISSAFVESLWKEADDTKEPQYTLAKSDSFEYENSLDRLRIRQMEHLWSRNYSNDDELISESYLHTQPGNKNLQTISELTSLKSNLSCSPETAKDTLPEKLASQCKMNKNLPEINENFYLSSQSQHFHRNSPGFLQFFGPPSELQSSVQIKKENICTQQPHLQQNLYLQRWKSETRDNLSSPETPVLTDTKISRQQSPQFHLGRSASEVPLSSTGNKTFTTNTPSYAKRFDMNQRHSPIETDASSQIPPFGYSAEYLDKAKMFGKVVAARKPGHHVGPTKNPNCSCACCQRWLNERFQTQAHIFSLGEMPVLKRPS